MRLLLLSNGAELIGENPTAFAQTTVKDFLGGIERVLFIPYAAVTSTSMTMRHAFGALSPGLHSQLIPSTRQRIPPRKCKRLRRS